MQFKEKIIALQISYFKEVRSGYICRHSPIHSAFRRMVSGRFLVVCVLKTRRKERTDAKQVPVVMNTTTELLSIRATWPLQRGDLGCHRPPPRAGWTGG